ncbi:MAG: dTMP kinase [Verrucomicrobiae bacterium]|nr:dTMP kinase [Verrucomicrobiae bacterium]
MTGCLITFEGSEGCGKSTQIQLLMEKFKAQGQTALLTREPGGTRLGEHIRHLLKFSTAGKGMVPEAELLLFCASRAQHYRELIKPAIEAGKIVICDRFLDSTTVYQGLARGIPIHLIEAAHQITLGDFRPHLTLLLDMDAEKARLRALRRVRPAYVGEDRMEIEEPAFYQKVREGYLQIAKKEKRFHIINADITPEELAQHIWKEISHVLDHCPCPEPSH